MNALPWIRIAGALRPSVIRQPIPTRCHNWHAVSPARHPAQRILARLAVVLALFSVASGADVAVIAHRAVPIDILDRQRLLDVYTGDIRLWTDETAVVVLDLGPRGESRHTFYKFLGKSPSRMKSIWMKNLLAGESKPPESMSTEDELLRKVAATPGAVGFVTRSKVTDEVKTLIVIPRRRPPSPYWE